MRCHSNNDVLCMYSCVAATLGDGAVELTFNYIASNSTSLCQHYGLLDVHTGTLTCYCPHTHVLADDRRTCIGIVTQHSNYIGIPV